VISDQGLAVTATSGLIGYPTSLANVAINPGEKVMFSMTIDTWVYGMDTTAVGIANHLYDVNQYLGEDLNSIGFWDSGNIYIDSTPISGYPLFGFSGAIIDVAVDRVHNLIWMRVNGGLWNNNSLANPNTAQGGVDISYIAGIVYPGCCPWYYSGQPGPDNGKISINTLSKYTVPFDFKFIGQEHGAWVPPGAETTFDLVLHYEVDAFANTGTGYNIGDRILIAGSDLGGTDALNSVTIIVQDTNPTTGAITIVNLQGTAPLLSDGETYTNISGTTIIGSGINASFDFVVGSGQKTTFDATSMRFEAPVDIYTNTNAFDKYLVFPRRNILV
jgi:hypothetical protein